MSTVNQSKLYSYGGLAFSMNVVVYVVLSFVFSFIVVFTGIDIESDLYLYMGIMVSPIAITITVSTIKATNKLTFFEATGANVKCHPKYYLIGVLLIFGMLFSLGWVNTIAVSFFERYGYEPLPSDSYIPNLEGLNIIPAIIFMAVFPAVFEETFFRGVLLNGIENRVGSVGSIFIVGFCFSLFHGSPEQTVYQFLVGCGFALLTVRAKSTLPAILAHFLNNALVVVIQRFFPDGNLPITESQSLLLVVLSMASLAGAITWLVLDKTDLKKEQKGGVAAFFICASVGILVMAILWFSTFIG